MLEVDNNIKNTLAFIAISALLLFILFNSSYSYPWERLYNIAVSGLSILVISILLLFVLRKSKFKLSKIDLLLIAFLSYDIIVFIIHRKTIDSLLLTLNSISLLAFFIVCKKVFLIETYHKYLFYFIYSLSILLSAGTVYMFLNNESSFRQRAGFFTNSGFNGILIAITGIITLIYFINAYRHLSLTKIFFSSIPVLLIIYSIVLTQSRTALLALIIVIFLYLIKKNFYISTEYKDKMKLFLFAIAGIVLIGFLTWYLTSYFKINSANGRIFTWQLTLDIIMQNLIYGIGHGEFGYFYNQSQISYFINNPESNNIYRADNLTNPFNDYLYTFSEKGIIGFCILISFFFAVIWNFIKNKVKDNHQIFMSLFFMSLLLCLLICGFTSYCFSLLSQKLLLVLFTANLSSTFKKETFILSKKYFICSIILLTFIASIYSYYIYQFNMWRKASESVFLKPVESFQSYNDVYPALKTSGEFLYLYGTDLLQLGKTDKAVTILEEARRYYAHSDLYLTLGSGYKLQNKFSLAECNYLLAHHIRPDQFTPLFYLLELYKYQNNISGAKAIALKIQRLKPKRKSKITDEIKRLANDILLNNKIK